MVIDKTIIDRDLLERIRGGDTKAKAKSFSDYRFLLSSHISKNADNLLVRTSEVETGDITCMNL